MGSSQSAHVPQSYTREQIYADLDKNVLVQFDSLELNTIASVFDQLATPVADTVIWTEDTFVKFLELPDEVGSLLFLSASFVASFPYTDESPAILSREALLRAIAIMLGRTTNIMSQEDRRLLLYKSFAIIEKRVEEKAPIVENSKSNIEKAEQGHKNSATDLRIRRSDLQKLIKFFLTIGEKKPVEVVSHYIERFTGKDASQFSKVAECIVNSISRDDKISFEELSRLLVSSPGVLSSLPSLYSHFLYPTTARSNQPATIRSLSPSSLLNNATASQLGLFLPRESVYGKVDALYRASQNGFSMGAFETKVLRYPGPTVLILEGDSDEHGLMRFGLYGEVPWKKSAKETFGDANTVFFQLYPQHKIFRGTALRHHTWFAKSLGIGIGCLPPSGSNTQQLYDFSSASMVLDTSLEYAVVRDESAASSVVRIAIQDVEVWGLGGDKEAQRKAWEWEENEANRRRNINLKDIQADYDLLEMAGLVGQNRSGGSV